MPRTIVQVPGSKSFLVVDMGGWAPNKGSLYLLRQRSDGQYENTLLKAGLNLPHGLRLGPGGFFYLGESDKVMRFRFEEGEIRDWRPVLVSLPRYKGHMHPLVSLAFDPRNGDLYVNSGSPSDHCFVKSQGSYSSCPEDTEVGLAVILRIPASKLQELPAAGLKLYEVAAKGLRNSIAMEVHPAGLLLQGENGRDFPQLEEPYEELNVIDLSDDNRGSKHYGWPYCYDFHAVSPEWKFSQNSGDPLHQRFTAPVDCAPSTTATSQYYEPPYILMPPHVAPLHMGYYPPTGQLAGLLQGKLLVSWHGWQPTGHRLVAYAVDNRGLPLHQNPTGRESYSVDVKGGCPVQKPFQPEGGMDRYSAYSEVISQWSKVAGVRPQGAPVGFTVAEDGSIFIVEDKNRTIVRLARSDRPAAAGCTDGQGNATDYRMELLAWRHHLETHSPAKVAYLDLRKNVLQKYCAGCHGGFTEKEIGADFYSELDYLVKNDFFAGGNSMASKLYQALAHTGEVPAMPPADVAFPSGEAGNALVSSVKKWIDSLPPGTENSVKKTSMRDDRRIRSQPSAAGKECGRLAKGEFVYTDPRPEGRLKKDGWIWAKVYLLPGDSRLYKGACAYPLDGVFYLTVSRQ
jgi:hypothetical protein